MLKTRGRSFAYAPHTGAVLKNGAIVLVTKRSSVDGWDIVLALRQDEQEFVVWNLGPDGELQSGMYTGDITDAFVEFERRS